MRTRHAILAALSCALLLSVPVQAQTLLGVDGVSATAWEFTPSPGGACPAPTPFLAGCPYGTPTICGTPGPGPIPAGSVFGDIADDPLTDTFWLTDGFIIQNYTEDSPCFGAMTCNTLGAFFVPSFIGPITGMCFDNSSPVSIGAGAGVLWLTDGRDIVGVVPPAPGSCNFTVAFGPCSVILPTGGIMTDITWDFSTMTIWASGSAGFVHNIDVLACNYLSTLPVTNCGLGPGLTGIAFDGGTPAAPPLLPSLPAMYVTDGLMVERLDITGAPAAPTFGAPVTCTPTPAFLSGLALTQHGTTYGTSRAVARLETFGNASTPSTSFGLEVYNAPAGDNAWLIIGFNFPGLGYFCPPITGASTNIWVDFTPPGSITNLGPLPGPCVALPAFIPAATPIGLELFAQIVFIPTTGPPASDATNGVAVTVMLP
jgi:hypothetical protein